MVRNQSFSNANQQAARRRADMQFNKRIISTYARSLIGLIILVTAVLSPSFSFAQTATEDQTDSKAVIQKLQEMLGTLEKKVDEQQKQIEELKNQKPAATQTAAPDQTKTEVAMPVSTPAVSTDQANSNATKEASLTTENAKTKSVNDRLDALENPLALRYKNLLIIPGGFIAAESVFRTRNENSDMGSSFGGIPFDGTANANLSEFHMSGRATRASVTLKTKYRDIDLTGFYEIDWFGVTAANDVKSNSYSPRQRQLWIRADFKNGWSFTAGQMWSLMVRGKEGMSTGQEDSAPGDLIEGSFIVGHVWERQTGVRIVKNFNDKVWVGFAAENPETTYSATNVPLYTFGLNTSANSTTPSSDVIPYAAGVANGYSTNLAPDLIGKVAFEPGWGHYEIKGIYRYFRSRNNGTNYHAYGAGLGWSTKLPFTKKLDFITEGLAGEGIGRYSSGGGPDITLHPDGSPVPVKQLHVSAGLEYRPNWRLSLYGYEGNEYYQRAAYVNSNGLGVGYGSPLMSNQYCEVEVATPETPSCTAQNRNINQVIVGFWYRFFRGPYGTLQYGMNYEHLRRNTWWAVGGQPSGHDDVVETSVRFVLP